jgi:tRNA dimethylallyltransferase
MGKLLVVCGPTATGKTDLALKLARKFKGELVNADSRQIYRGMDIGTGKDLPVNSKLKTQNLKLELGIEKYQFGYYLVSGVPIWLLDIVWPNYRFSVADYLQVAIPVIKNIWARGKLPILVGGTGFYIKALLMGAETLGIKPDWVLRKRLEKLTIAELQERLMTVAPRRFGRLNQSDRKNPRRLIRAIEITVNSSKKLPKVDHLVLDKSDVLYLGLKVPYEKLDRLIVKRVRIRLGRGLLKEIETLLTKYTFGDSVLGKTIAYQEWQDYFKALGGEKKKLVLKKAATEKWVANERRYARRQMTWFRKNNLINWFRSDDRSLFLAVAKKVRRWYIKDDD